MVVTPQVNRLVYETSRFLWGLFFNYYTGYQVEGKENIPTKGPLIVVSNHVSNLDIFAVGYAFKPYVTYPGKKEAFEDPKYGIYLRAMGGFPLDRDEVDTHAAKILFELMREGRIVGIMPEGTRSLDGKIHPFKPGFVKLAIKTGAPILPIAIVGTDKVLPKWRWIPQRSRITLIIGKPIDLSKYHSKKITEKESQQIADEIRRVISELSRGALALAD